MSKPQKITAIMLWKIGAVMLAALVLGAALFGILVSMAHAAGAISVDKNNGSCVTGSGQGNPYGVVYCTIQDAVADAAAGDTVSVAAGTYSGTVSISTPITLTGQGASTIIQAQSPGLVISASGTIISNTTIVGTGIDQGITTTLGTNNVSVLNTAIHSFVVGIQFNGGSGHVAQSDTITNATTVPGGIGVFAADSSNVQVDNVTVINYGTGIEVLRTGGSNGITLTNNIIDYTTGTTTEPGIYLLGSGVGVGTLQALVQSNQVGGYGPLIKAEGLAPAQVLNNTLDTTGTSIDGAISLNQAGSSVVQGNTLLVSAPVASTTLTGILIGGTASPTVTQNSIASRFTFGIETIDSATPVIIDSTLSGHGGAGLRASGSATPQLLDSLFTNNLSGISLNSTTALVTATGNTICQNSSFGLRSSNTYLVQQATDNWWGHNPPLDDHSDSTAPSDYRPNVNAADPISMALTVEPPLISLSGSSAVTLTMRSSNQNVRDGTGISFSAASGSFGPAATSTLNGLATTVYTPSVVGAQVITATDDCGGVATATLTVGQTQLTAVKSAQPPAGGWVSPGQLITYTVWVENSGALTATGAVFSDTIPAFTTLAFATVDSGTIAATNPVSATFDPIAPGQAMTVTVGVTVTLPLTNGTLITNTAAVTYFDGAATVVAASNAVTHVVQSAPALTLTKQATPPSGSPVIPGDVITYTITLSNTGDANATNVVFSDTIPLHTSLVFSDATAGVSLVGGNPFGANVALLPAPAGSAVITLAVQVTSPLTNGVVVTNTAQVTSTEVTTPAVSNAVTHIVSSAPVLTLTKQADPPSGGGVLAGGTITYTLTVENGGNANATGVIITDTLDGNLNFVQVTPSAGVNTAGPLVFDVGTLAGNGGVVSYTVVVTVGNAVLDGTTITNAAQLTFDGGGVQTSNTVTHVVSSEPILTVAKLNNPPNIVNPGEPLNYTLRVRNIGAGTATNVVVTDSLPSEVNYLSTLLQGAAVISSANAGPPWRLNIASLPPGEQVEATVFLTVSTPLADGLVFTNSATFRSNQTVEDSSNTVSNTVSAAVLQIAKTADPPSGPIRPGESITYTVTVTNTGSRIATDVVISDTVDPNVTVVFSATSPAAPIAAGNPVQATWPSLAPGNSASLVLRVTVNDPLASGTIIANAAGGSASNAASVTSSVVTHSVVTSASLQITKLAEPASGTYVVPGGTITYTIIVTNNTAGLATGVRISDTLDANTGLISVTPGGGVLSTDPLIIDAGNVGSGGVVSYTVVVTVATGLADGTVIANSALVTATNVPTIYVSPGVVHTVYTGADLEVSKVGSPSPATVGFPLTYTVTITNNGPETANLFFIQDALPANVLYDSSSAPGASCGYFFVVNCTFNTPLPPGSSTTAEIVVFPTKGGTLTNVVGVGIINPAIDPIDSNDTFTETTPAISAPFLQVSKTAQPGHGSTVEPGDRITYTVVARNIGDATATGVVVSDTIDASVTLVTSNTTAGTLSGPNPVQVSGLSLAANQAVTLTLGVDVTSSISGTIISNRASVDSTQTPLSVTDPVTHVISATVPTVPSFTVTKSANPVHGPTVDPGDRITYTVVVANSGGAATNVVMTDTIPAGTTYVPGSASRTPNLGGITFDGTNVVMSVPNFPALTTITATFQVTVTTNQTTTLSNHAELTSTETSLQNSNTVTHAVRGIPSGPSTVYLPIIYKNFANASLSIYWDDVEPVRDKVGDTDDGPTGLVPDGKTDGLFKVVIDPGSESKTVTKVRLLSTQSFEWDTQPGNSNPVLGVFIGSATRLNQNDGSINQSVPFAVTVTLYASDDVVAMDRFPPELYIYTVIVEFSDGTSLSASTSIPPEGGGGGGGGGASCAPAELASITVGNSPRGVAVDTDQANRAYVANFGSSSVSVLQNNAVAATITGVTTANGIAYDSINKLIWVTNYSTNQVTPIQTSDNSKLTPIDVGAGPWGVVHDNTANNYVYVVNRSDNSVTVINASTKAKVATLTGSFSDPAHIAANPVTGKVYVANHGNNSVTVINGTTVTKVVSLADSTQPYGITVDETRNLVYVATVNSHRIVVLGELSGVQDQFLGWAAFHRGFNDPARPVPLRVIDINPDMGPVGDGGHLWTTTSTNDGSERNQVLLIPKGWDAYFHLPIARDIGANPAEGIAVDRAADDVYVTSGANPGLVTVLSDSATTCLEPFAVDSTTFGMDVVRVVSK